MQNQLCMRFTMNDQILNELGKINLRFEAVDQRFDGHERRFDKIDETLVRHEKRFDKIDDELHKRGIMAEEGQRVQQQILEIVQGVHERQIKQEQMHKRLD